MKPKIEHDSIKIDRLYRNTIIYEYDIKSANTSLMGFYKLQPNDIIDQINHLPKHERTYKVGMMMRNDKVFSLALSKAFINARLLFGTVNNLNDEDIVSVKKDAIFTTKLCDNLVFTNDIGNKIVFVCKNKYTNAFRLKNIEIYSYYDELNSDMRIDIKGINSELVNEIHNDGICIILKTVIRMLECNMIPEACQYVSNMYDDYKKRILPYDYYYTFDNRSSLITSNITDWGIDESTDKDILDIEYNIKNVFIPLIEMLIAL